MSTCRPGVLGTAMSRGPRDGRKVPESKGTGRFRGERAKRPAVARAGCVASRGGCGADPDPVRMRKPAEESKYRQTRG